MPYIDLRRSPKDRRTLLRESFKHATTLGTQLCIVFELLWLHVIGLEFFSDYCNKPITGVKGVTIPTKSLQQLWRLLDINMETVSRLELFRNDYVHNGVVAAEEDFVDLLSEDNLIPLLKICKKVDITLNFELPL